LFLLLLLLLAQLREGHSGPSGREKSHDEKAFYVQVSGDVPYPGVYTFSMEPPLRDLLTLAGIGDHEGLSYDAVPLRNGAEVEVCDHKESLGIRISDMSAFFKMTLRIPLSLNRESAEGLTAIPGIGPRTAGAIVRERAERGGFQELDELLSVPGIGPALLEKMRPYLDL